jgi:CDP-diacylglycerol--glycerol-3-phosphate 3-phosphatidyltransferase
MLAEMEAHAVPLPLRQLPNALTIARLVAIPVFVALMVVADGTHSWPAGIVFGVAAVTDQIDGFLARRWHVESEFGKLADPLADRLMIDAAVILLVVFDRLPWEALAIIVARDVALLFGSKFAIERGYDFQVSVLGKLATWLLYAGVGFTIVTRDGTTWPLVLFWVGLGVALVAGGLYVVSAWRTIRR